MNAQETKDTILVICQEALTRPGTSDLLDWLENKSDFFTAPASTRFHGNYEGGLAEHSLNVYHALKELLTLYKVESEYSAETIAIVTLFHDICKTNFYKKVMKNVKNPDTGKWEQAVGYDIDDKYPFGDHADKSIIILQHFIKLEPDEIYAIRGHMGGYDSAVQGGSRFLNGVFEKSKLAVLTHLADMVASHLIEN